ncbi:hypothetical protein DL767_000116 [Monosporascus sp. MG133]|nr:hypothetical protein DL767_000116 [Monosporascus sp. MG133]
MSPNINTNITETLLADALARFAQIDLNGLPWSQLISALLVLTVCTWLYMPTFDGVSAPFAGYRSPLEPSLLVRMRFAREAPGMIDEGYSKVLYLLAKSPEYGSVTNATQWKNSMYKVSRHDGDLVILSRKYVDELQNIPTERLSSIKGLIKNFGGRYSGIELLAESDIGTRAIQAVTMTQMATRAVPPAIRPFLNLVLRFSWKYKASIRSGKKILAPEVQHRRHLAEIDPDYVKPNDLLQAMMDMSTPGGKDSQPENLAHRQLVITLVAGHSTAAAGSHALFDLVAKPQYVDELRGEVIQVLQEDGGCWGKQSLSKLRKMDSFLRESVPPQSQRWNPPSLLGFHRIVEDRAGITLHDGVHLPYGTHLCVAPDSISRDRDVIPNPDVFDGLRYYEQRRQNPGESMKHQHATADKNHLHFGYGTWSCPGRFLASDELKIILATLLLRYEFRYAEGSSRPTNRNVDEFPYVDTETPLLMRRREDGEGNAAL